MPPLAELPPGYDPQKDKIEIVPYDSRWPELYLQEEAALKKAIGSVAGLRFDHYGSTAVPGLSAKPIIDILIRAERSYWSTLIKPIEGLGYFYWASNPEQETLYFAKGMPPFGERRTHHIHVFEPEREKEIRFRDHLRSHPETAKAYEALKRELAGRFTHDRKGYTDAKTEFIEGILAKESGGGSSTITPNK